MVWPITIMVQFSQKISSSSTFELELDFFLVLSIRTRTGDYIDFSCFLVVSWLIKLS